MTPTGFLLALSYRCVLVVLLMLLLMCFKNTPYAANANRVLCILPQEKERQWLLEEEEEKEEKDEKTQTNPIYGIRFAQRIYIL